MRLQTSPARPIDPAELAGWTGFPTPAAARRAVEPLARRLGGVPAGPDSLDRVRLSAGMAFGFVPLVLVKDGAYGFFAPAGVPRRVARPAGVAWWDAARGQVAPLASDFGRFARCVERLGGVGPAARIEDHRRALALDAGASASAVALALRHVGRGRVAVADALLRHAAAVAPWWMAPAVLLHRMHARRGRDAEAAAWAAEALSRRWDATGAGRQGLVPELGSNPRDVLRDLIGWLSEHEDHAPGLRFDPAWTPLRRARDPLDPAAQEESAAGLERTGRLVHAAWRWEWLLLSCGRDEAAERLLGLLARLGWALHRAHLRDVAVLSRS